MITPVRTTFFTKRVRDCSLEKCILLKQSMTCSGVVDVMKREKVSSVLLQDDDNQIVSIVTEQDIVRRVIYNNSKQRPIEDFSSQEVKTINHNHFIYRAIGLMIKNKLNHIPVVDDDFKPIGILKLAVALSFANDRMMEEVIVLTQQTNFKGLKAVKEGQFSLVVNLFQEGLNPSEILEVISRLNNDINRQALKIIVRQMIAENWGEPPVEFVLVIMGSGGRLESFMTPDQDNGFILKDYPDEDHNTVDEWFRECAQRLNIALDEIGFSLCTGNIMARNPIWRKTLSQYKTQIKLWLKRKTRFAERYADIFFDFTFVSGQRSLAEELRAYITKACPSKRNFMRELYLYDNSTIAMGMFNRLLTSKVKGYKGKMDLKTTGTMPMVHCLRMVALQYKIEEVSTKNRLNKIMEQQIFSQEFGEKLLFTFEHITGLILKQQIDDHTNKRPVTVYIEPKKLSMLDKALLVESFKIIKELKLKTKEMFTGQLI